MAGRPTSSRSFPRLAGGFVATAIVLIAVADALSPARVTLSILYVVPLLACMYASDRRLLWVFAAVCVALGLGTFVLRWVADPASPTLFLYLLINRSLAAVACVLVAVLLHFLIGASQQVERARRDLEDRKSELEVVNADLVDREQQIAAQNEELRVQSDEFEQQGEQLRVANEQLADRENRLRRLVEMSRGITADVGRDRMLLSACEAALELSSGQAEAVAIVERADDRLVLLAQCGFGDAGPAEPAIPYATSLAALVLERQQTAYVEDLRLRPDLRVMRPADQALFRSILATPLWVRGRCIGALQLYARDPRRWSAEQVELIEALGAHTSISLETAQLIEGIEAERLRFEAVLRTMPIGVLVAEDPACRRVRGNPAAVALYRMNADANFSILAPSDEFIPRQLLREGVPLAPEQHPLVRATTARQSVSGEELELVFPDGRRLALLVSAAPILDAGGQVTGAVSAFADVTHLKQLQAQLDTRRREAEESSARKTRFLAAVSHDIRTPANAINLLAELIRRGTDSPALAGELPQLVADLQASAVALVELVSDVLDLARLDAGSIDLQFSEFPLAAAILEEVRHVVPLAEQKRLRLEVEPPARAIHLRTDRIKLGRVLGNLLNNAIKFTAEGFVRVRADAAADGRVRIAVRDSGVGIAPQHLARIFDEFFQLHNPDRDQRKGIGLGLTICARLVEAMGGQITVDSEPGRGSTFTVVLPPSAVVGAPAAAARPGMSPAPESPTAQPLQQLSGLRVLLVEDHPSTRRATSQILSTQGAQVIEAADGRSALRLLYDAEPQVVLLDMKLPDLDGAEVLKAIAARRPPALRNVLVLTGDMTPARVEEVRQLGADALIPKPIDLKLLLDHMRRAGDNGEQPRAAGEA